MGELDTSRYDKPGRTPKDGVTIGAIVVAVLTGGGGIFSLRDVSVKLDAVSVSLVKIEARTASFEAAALRQDTALGKLEDRIRGLETNMAERKALEDRVARLEKLIDRRDAANPK